MSTSSLIVPAQDSNLVHAHVRTQERVRTGAAVAFLAGVLLALIGFAWDVQWHRCRAR